MRKNKKEEELIIVPSIELNFSLEENDLVVETYPELDEIEPLQLYLIAARCITVAGQKEGIEKALEKTQNLVYANRKGEIDGKDIRKQL